MAITKGTPGSFPIDFGISERISGLLGRQVGAYNPAQSGVQGLDYSNSSAAVQTLNSGGAINPQGSASMQPQGPGGAFPIKPIGPTRPDNVNAGGGQPSGGNSFDIQPTSPTPDEVGNTYNAIFDTLNQAESNLRGQLPGLISEAEAQANINRQMLESGKQASQEQLTSQQQQTQNQQNSLEAEQRRILQEQQIANQQRFGGASSAGQAASELQGREFQRSRFGIQQNAQQALQEIQGAARQVEREYQNNLQQLQVNLQQAKNDIQRRFQDRLLEINSRRNEAESAKQQARLQALQQLRNEAQQINIARAQFEADLRAQAQANQAQLQSAAQQFMLAQQQGQQASDAFGSYQASGIPGVQVNTRSNANLPSLTGIRDEDLIGSIGTIPGSSDRDPRFQNFQPMMRQ